VALKEKPGADGLVKSEIMDLFNMLTSTEAFPIELEALDHECSAMGFIDPAYAEMLDYDYERSGFHDFIASILDDMDNESENGEYEYQYNGFKIPVYVSR
jgi:hypothetical protein